MMKNNIKEIIQKLTSYGYFDAYRIAKEIIEFADDDPQKVKDILLRLSKNEPWDYVKGYTEFCGLQFLVTKDVLVPRIETEQIIEILKRFDTTKVKQIIDIGTGSGILAITIKKIYPQIDVIGIDISEKALDVAKENAKKNNVEVEYIENNLLDGIDISKPTIIVANLPYIPHKEVITLHESVKEYEPNIALDGGFDGLDYIRPILKEIVKNISIIGGIFEIDPSQKGSIIDIMKGSSYEFIKDIRGLIRFFKFNR